MGGTFALALCLLLAGWGWAAWMAPRSAKPKLWEAVLLALAGSGFWAFTLAILGLPWTEPFLLLPTAMGWLLALARLRRLAQGLRDDPGPVILVLAALALLTRLPAWGWDFRYIWGLKAKVFLSAGGHDVRWLAQESVAFAHPTYPTLWSDTLVIPMVFGLSVEDSAAIWLALLRLSLAALCGELAGGRGRYLAAGVGFFAPYLFRPSFSGYAEPLVAFLLGCSLLVSGEKGVLRWLALALLPLAKGEGLLWVFSLGLAWFFTKRSLVRGAFLTALFPALLWYLQARQTFGNALLPSVSHGLERLQRFPQAFAEASNQVLWMTIGLALALVLAHKRTPLALASGFFTLGLVAVYLMGTHPLSWWLENSWARVLSVPFPLLIAAALGGTPKPEMNPLGQQGGSHG